MRTLQGSPAGVCAAFILRRIEKPAILTLPDTNPHKTTVYAMTENKKNAWKAAAAADARARAAQKDATEIMARAKAAVTLLEVANQEAHTAYKAASAGQGISQTERDYLEGKFAETPPVASPMPNEIEISLADGEKALAFIYPYPDHIEGLDILQSPDAK